ncbi:MAG: iron chelate uptake ABC transporter family permease subunit [Saprospiraceae bacterium]|nr:iron chelate uptake ABC transporter family permease subunit [Saprospiraceae bacterium]NNL93930.1 iron chelate uptake ABC transporter family permease subunit [Saprospiraceae bacterium]
MFLIDFLDTFTSVWAIRAMIASSLVGLMCGILGCFIVLRNMSLIGDALSHAVLPGIFFAFLVVGYSTIGFFIGSTIAGLVTALAISWIQQNVPTKNDAAIGIIFTAMFSIGVIGISWISRKDGVHLDLDHFLFGNVLGISNQDIYLTLGVAIYTILCTILFYRYLFITTFQPTIAQTMGISPKLIHYFLMLLLSFAIVASLRTVGVILVVAMLITPAATALLFSDRLQKVIVLSAFIGLLSALLGFVVSVAFDTTPGPAMTLVATFIYFTAVLLSPSKGLLFKMNQKRIEKKRIIREDILRQVIKKPLNVGMSVGEISVNLKLPLKIVKSFANKMSKSSLLTTNGQNVILSDAGVLKAEQLVRAHRLWETYQVRQMGLDSNQIHDEADQLEHFLSEELIDEIDKQLGYPVKDPHDSPIPKGLSKSSTPSQ